MIPILNLYRNTRCMACPPYFFLKMDKKFQEVEEKGPKDKIKVYLDSFSLISSYSSFSELENMIGYWFSPLPSIVAAIIPPKIYIF